MVIRKIKLNIIGDERKQSSTASDLPKPPPPQKKAPKTK